MTDNQIKPPQDNVNVKSPGPGPGPGRGRGGRGKSRGRGRGRGRGQGRGRSNSKRVHNNNDDNDHDSSNDTRADGTSIDHRGNSGRDRGMREKFGEEDKHYHDSRHDDDNHNDDNGGRGRGQGRGRGGRGRGRGARGRGRGRGGHSSGRGRGRGRSSSSSRNGSHPHDNANKHPANLDGDEALFGDLNLNATSTGNGGMESELLSDSIQQMKVEDVAPMQGHQDHERTHHKKSARGSRPIRPFSEHDHDHDHDHDHRHDRAHRHEHKSHEPDVNTSSSISDKTNIKRRGKIKRGPRQQRLTEASQSAPTVTSPSTQSSTLPSTPVAKIDHASRSVIPAELITNATKQNDTTNTSTSNNSTIALAPVAPISNSKTIDRTESCVSLPLSEKSATEKDAKAPAGVIDLLKHKKNQNANTNANTKSTNPRDKKKEKDPKKKPKRKKPKKRPDDVISKQRAAKAFNHAIRKCVELSDPDGLYELLHDKKNHEFGLTADVLEIVLKAFVVAAMFDEALYCLRNCTKPGTMSTLQAEKVLQCLPQNLRNSSAFVAADMINALCIATDFDKPTHRTYFMRIVRGIALEFLEEATSARDRICSFPCERLVRLAVCVVDAKIRRGKKATELIVLPGQQLGIFVPDTMENRGIQAGDAVGILPYASPYPMSAESLDRNMIEATVTGINPMILRLQDKGNVNLYERLTEDIEGNVHRIDKLANRMGFNRQLSAAVALASPLEKSINGASPQFDAKRPSAELIKAISAMDENIDRAMINGNVGRNLHGSRGDATSTADLCGQAVPFFTSEETGYNENGEQLYYDQESIRDQARLALNKFGSFEGLNASQKLAVEGAATNRLTLVQGPPGTGKTAVAIRIMQHWARLARSETKPGESPKPILATSDSNIAVDNLVEGCANVGLKVVRLGRPEAIRPELLRHCVDRPRKNGQNYSSVYKEKLQALQNAQVVCCTCIGSGADILDNMSFERVLVDEATQATEPAVLVPLTRSCRQLVLVGDHCQLPPTVLSTRASEEGLGVPLFSRMVACGVPPFMLDTQYRMHPGIAMFPSDLFYGGKLISGVSPPERRPLQGFPWPREEFPVAFVPVHGPEVDDGVSKVNEAEAAAACDAVSALLAGGQCGPSDIAVVTPYAAQVRLIRRLTRRLVSGPPYVEVSSTDGFQGREKEAVVFSAVRSNDFGSVGFVSDWRRVNVSFTRARRGLIVIGNDVTLRRGDPDTWMPWLAWADAHGINMDKPGITRGRYDAEQLRRVRGGTTAAEMLKDVLERQQAQLKRASQQLEKAEKKSANHVLGNNETSVEASNNVHCEKSLNQDLALLTNTDGCWDDSEDEDNGDMHHSTSAATFTTLSSANTKVEAAQDAWDL